MALALLGMLAWELNVNCRDTGSLEGFNVLICGVDPYCTVIQSGQEIIGAECDFEVVRRSPSGVRHN